MSSGAGRRARAARVPVVLGHECQNPVRRPQRQRASTIDLAHQIWVAQRLDAERRRPQARAPEERTQPRAELLLQRLHARNGEDPFGRTSTRRKCPKFLQCISISSNDSSLSDASASGVASAPAALATDPVKRVELDREVGPDRAGLESSSRSGRLRMRGLSAVVAPRRSRVRRRAAATVRRTGPIRTEGLTDPGRRGSARRSAPRRPGVWRLPEKTGAEFEPSAPSCSGAPRRRFSASRRVGRSRALESEGATSGRLGIGCESARTVTTTASGSGCPRAALGPPSLAALRCPFGRTPSRCRATGRS